MFKKEVIPMINPKYYVNSPKQKHLYKELINDISKSKKFNKDMKELNIDKKDIDMYLSCIFLDNSSALLSYDKEIDKTDDYNRKKQLSQKIFNNMRNNLLKQTKLTEKFVDNNNEYFKNFSHKINDFQNPFIVDQKTIDREFNVSSNSVPEIYSKNMLWSSRLAKISDIVKRNIISNSCKNKNSDYHAKICGKIYERLRDKLLLHEENPELYSKFMNEYSVYIHGNIETKKELENSSTYKELQNFIDSFKETKNYKITPDSFFKYLACAESSINLYEIKAHNIELLINEYSKNKSKDFALQKSIDKDSKCKNYNSDFMVSLPGYNTVFKVHSNKMLIDEYEKKYNVKLIESPDKAPFPEYFHYKLTPSQNKMIKNFKRVNIKDENSYNILNYFYDRTDNMKTIREENYYDR